MRGRMVLEDKVVVLFVSFTIVREGRGQSCIVVWAW